MTNRRFLILYLIFMLPTYIWRGAMLALMMYMFGHNMLFWGYSMIGWGVPTLLYLCLAWIAYRRGKVINKSYLAVFPIIGGFVDVLLPYVPFVATIMHVLTLVIGFRNGK